MFQYAHTPLEGRMVQIPKLREWREARALTQVELAERAGLSSRSVAGYEAGAGARPPTVRKLAEALGVEVADLRGGPENPLGETPPSPTQPPLNGFEEERRDYGSRVWERINLLDAAAEQWQRFVDEGLYDLKKPDFELLKLVDRVSLGIVLNHGREAAAMKRASTDEERARLEQAERRLIDSNLDFWARVESALERTAATDHDELEAKRALKAQRAPWEPVLRKSRTA
jgi:transcriptional regulator with XRE-family HTH domain